MTSNPVNGFGAAALLAVLLVPMALAQEETPRREPDPETYVPRAGFEAAPADAQTSEDPEAFQPRPDYEDPVGYLDETATLPSVADDSELRPGKPPSGDEAFVPGPDFEEVVGGGRKDPERFEPKPDFEREERQPGKVLGSPQEVQEPGEILLGKEPVRRRFEREGRLERHGEFGFVLQTEKEPPLSFELKVPSPRLSKIVEERANVRVLATGRTTPVGRSEGLAIATADRLEYVFERRLDPRGFSPRDLRGLEVRPLHVQEGEPVFKGPCRVTYEVPTEFAWGSQHLRLAAGETGEFVEDGRRYAITVLRSLAHFPIECGASFELPPHEVEYVLWSQ